jgi:hypothetical protein
MNHKNLIQSILLTLIVFTTCIKVHATENLTVSRAKDIYMVTGQISGNELYKSNSAGDAIQFAIDKHAKGGTVVLQTGNYVVKKQINLRSFITLTGSGPSTIIRMQENHDTGIAINGDTIFKAVVSNLSIVASKNDSTAIAAIKLSSSGDCQISDIFCVGMKHAGVWLATHTYLTEIRGCKFADIKGSGVLLEFLRSGVGGEYVPNLVSNCIAYRCGIGFRINNAVVVNFNQCAAHQCKNVFNFNRGASVSITSCRSFQIEEEAVVLYNSAEINITGNIFCWSEKEAIKLNKVTWGTISGNNLIDIGSINYYTREMNPEKKRKLFYPVPEGVEVPLYSGLTLSEVKGLTISGNAIFNWNQCPKMLYGIYEEKNCAYNLITSNNINWVKNEGIKSLGKNTLVANNLILADENHKPNNADYQQYDKLILDEIIEKMLEYVND